ncbi:MAG: DUF4230 domain-containing protein [Lachnospiraceae bacterium]|nr:DUF4230 domain-containing protein [Lachnospiraceae bacterium]
MKKYVIAALLIFNIFCVGCGKTDKAQTIEPQEAQMRSICELATMECYYHNVAKYKEEDAEKFLWMSKDKHFWMEFTGTVTLGIDASLVTIDVKDEDVTITLPPAKVLDCKVDENSLTEDSIIVAKKSADVKAEDQTEAFKEAKSNLEKTAGEDVTLLAGAQQRAQKLLEDYVNNIGECVGKNYKIKWVYLEEKPEGEN